jgi:hypothetical protein
LGFRVSYVEYYWVLVRCLALVWKFKRRIKFTLRRRHFLINALYCYCNKLAPAPRQRRTGPRALCLPRFSYNYQQTIGIILHHMRTSKLTPRKLTAPAAKPRRWPLCQHHVLSQTRLARACSVEEAVILYIPPPRCLPTTHSVSSSHVPIAGLQAWSRRQPCL